MRSLLVVFVLGTVGAASAIITAKSTTFGPAPIGAILVVAAVSVAILRFMRLGLTYRQAFLNCMGIGLLMMVLLSGWLDFVEVSDRLPWYLYALSWGFMIVCVGFFGAMAAAVVWTPPAGRRSILRTRCIQILSGCTVFSVANILVAPLSSGGAHLGWALTGTAFFFFFLAVVSWIVYLPLLLTVRLVIRARLPVAVIGAVLFPIPMLGVSYLQGRGPAYAKMLSELPVSRFLAIALPFVLGGAALGWLLATDRSEVARAAS